MSDEKLRQLERRHQASGDLEDLLAWLKARERSGERIQNLLYDYEHYFARDPIGEIEKIIREHSKIKKDLSTEMISTLTTETIESTETTLPPPK